MLLKSDIQRIADLSRIRLTEKEAEDFANNLSSILGYISQLKKVESDVSDGQLRESDINNVWREDENDIRELDNMGKNLINMAPERQGGYVKVKKVL